MCRLRCGRMRSVVLPSVVRRLLRRAWRRGCESGISTAEYAVGTVAACGFAALLFKILTSGEVHRLMVGLVTRALHLAG